MYNFDLIDFSFQMYFMVIFTKVCNSIFWRHLEYSGLFFGLGEWHSYTSIHLRWEPLVTDIDWPFIDIELRIDLIKLRS